MNAQGKRRALLVFIDGTIADDRHRLGLHGTGAFDLPERVRADRAAAGSAACLTALSKRCDIVYIGARDPSLGDLTRSWLSQNGFPPGEVLLARTYGERLLRAGGGGAPRVFRGNRRPLG